MSTEGKGVRVMHLFNDNLWIYGFTHQKEKERVIPEGFTAKQILPVAQVEDVDSDDEEDPTQEATKEGESIQESNGEQPVEPSTETKEGAVTPEEMDKYLETAFMETIKNHIVDDELPLDISAVYTRMIMNSGIHLDVKKSTYKKIGKFIKEMVQKKRIKTKEARDVVQVVSVNRSHQEYKSHVSLPTVVKQTPVEQPKEQSVASKKVQILYFFKVPKLLIPIFAVDGPVDADKSVFTEKETKQHLMKYLAKECKLPEQHNGNATLNQFLFEQLFRTKKEEKDPLQEGSLTSIARIHKKYV
jgi:translation initiation factor 2D